MELMKTYSEQRKERLSDAVFDYLADENTTADELLNDFIDVVKDTFDYYDNHASHCKGVLDALNTVSVTKHSSSFYDFDRNGGSSYSPNITEATAADWNDFWNSIDNKE